MNMLTPDQQKAMDSTSSDIAINYLTASQKTLIDASAYLASGETYTRLAAIVTSIADLKLDIAKAADKA